MKKLIVFLMCMAMSTMAFAQVDIEAGKIHQDNTAIDVDDLIDDPNYKHDYRFLIVISVNENHPDYVAQVKEIRKNSYLLKERDVVILADTKPPANTRLRKRFFTKLPFQTTILDKQNQRIWRKDSVNLVHDMIRVIDKSKHAQREKDNKRPEPLR